MASNTSSATSSSPLSASGIPSSTPMDTGNPIAATTLAVQALRLTSVNPNGVHTSLQKRKIETTAKGDSEAKVTKRDWLSTASGSRSGSAGQPAISSKFVNLPDDVMKKILEYFDRFSLSRYTRLCKTFRFFHVEFQEKLCRISNLFHSIFKPMLFSSIFSMKRNPTTLLVLGAGTLHLRISKKSSPEESVTLYLPAQVFEPCQHFSFVADSQVLVAASNDGRIIQWNTENDKVQMTISVLEKEGYVSNVVVARIFGNFLLQGTAECKIFIRPLNDLKNATELCTLGSSLLYAKWLEANQDCTCVYTLNIFGGMFQLKIWDVATRKMVKTISLTYHQNFVNPIYDATQNRLIAVYLIENRLRIGVWNGTTGEELKHIDITDLIFAPIQANAQGFFDSTANPPRSSMKKLNMLYCDPLKNRIYAVFDHEIHIWSATTGKAIHVLKCNDKIIKHIYVDPHADILIAWGEGKHVLFFDIFNGKLINTLIFNQPIKSLSCNPEGGSIYILDNKNQLIIYDYAGNRFKQANDPILFKLLDLYQNVNKLSPEQQSQLFSFGNHIQAFEALAKLEQEKIIDQLHLEITNVIALINKILSGKNVDALIPKLNVLKIALNAMYGKMVSRDSIYNVIDQMRSILNDLSMYLGQGAKPSDFTYTNSQYRETVMAVKRFTTAVFPQPRYVEILEKRLLSENKRAFLVELLLWQWMKTRVVYQKPEIFLLHPELFDAFLEEFKKFESSSLNQYFADFDHLFDPKEPTSDMTKRIREKFKNLADGLKQKLKEPSKEIATLFNQIINAILSCINDMYRPKIATHEKLYEQAHPKIEDAFAIRTKALQHSSGMFNPVAIHVPTGQELYNQVTTHINSGLFDFARTTATNMPPSLWKDSALEMIRKAEKENSFMNSSAKAAAAGTAARVQHKISGEILYRKVLEHLRNKELTVAYETAEIIQEKDWRMMALAAVAAPPETSSANGVQTSASASASGSGSGGAPAVQHPEATNDKQRYYTVLNHIKLNQMERAQEIIETMQEEEWLVKAVSAMTAPTSASASGSGGAPALPSQQLSDSERSLQIINFIWMADNSDEQLYQQVLECIKSGQSKRANEIAAKIQSEKWQLEAVSALTTPSQTQFSANGIQPSASGGSGGAPAIRAPETQKKEQHDATQFYRVLEWRPDLIETIDYLCMAKSVISKKLKNPNMENFFRDKITKPIDVLQAKKAIASIPDTEIQQFVVLEVINQLLIEDRKEDANPFVDMLEKL